MVTVNELAQALDPFGRLADREQGLLKEGFVGRVRECPVLDFKFMALGHNTVRGAAGAAVLNAELMQAQGLL